MDLTVPGCLVQLHDPDLALAIDRDVIALEPLPRMSTSAPFSKLRASGAEIVQEPTERPSGTRETATRPAILVRIDRPPAASS
jgi:hypothetical protein